MRTLRPSDDELLFHTSAGKAVIGRIGEGWLIMPDVESGTLLKPDSTTEHVNLLLSSEQRALFDICLG